MAKISVGGGKTADVDNSVGNPNGTKEHGALSPHIDGSSVLLSACVRRTGLRTSWSASLVCSRLPRSAAFFVSGKLPPGVWSDAGGDTRRLPTPLPALSSYVTVHIRAYYYLHERDVVIKWSFNVMTGMGRLIKKRITGSLQPLKSLWWRVWGNVLLSDYQTDRYQVKSNQVVWCHVQKFIVLGK